MLDVLVLEDEQFTREFFRKILMDLPTVSNVYDTSEATEAIKLAKEYNPKLILLDIELRDQNINGLDAAQAIYAFNKEAYMVFVTGYAKYAVDSFAVHPYSYVIKPIIVDEFIQLIEEIAEKLASQNNRSQEQFVLSAKQGIKHIVKNDIVFIERQKNSCIIHTYKGIYQVFKSLDELEQELGEGFLRVHRSFLINAQHIKSVQRIYDRSYEIEFWAYPKKALMSRYQFNKYRDWFGI